MTESIRWMSTKEASERLGVTLRTLYRFIDEGQLAAYKFGRVIRLKESDVDDFIALMLKECSPAYVNACVRTMKALMNHAVKRRVISASSLTEKIKFEDVQLPEWSLRGGFPASRLSVG